MIRNYLLWNDGTVIMIAATLKTVIKLLINKDQTCRITLILIINKLLADHLILILIHSLVLIMSWRSRDNIHLTANIRLILRPIGPSNHPYVALHKLTILVPNHLLHAHRLLIQNLLSHLHLHIPWRLPN